VFEYTHTFIIFIFPVRTYLDFYVFTLF